MTKLFTFIQSNGSRVSKVLDEVVNDFMHAYKEQIPLKCEYTLKSTRWSRVCESVNWDENTIYEDNKIFIKKFTKNKEDFWLKFNDVREADYIVSFYEFYPGGDYIVFALKDLISYSFDE